MSNNIENIFKENLKNLNIEPQKDIWSGVKSNLWFSDIKNVFYNYTVNPANKLWKVIAFKLWLKEFFMFSPKTLNIYYVSAFILGVSLFYLNFDNITNFKNNIIENSSNNISQNNTTNVYLESYNNRHVILNNDKDSISENKTLIENLNNNNNIKHNINSSNNNVQFIEPFLVNDEEVLTNENIRDFSKLNYMTLLYKNLNFEQNYNNLNYRDVNDYNIKKWHWYVEAFMTMTNNNSIYYNKSKELNATAYHYANNDRPNNFCGGFLFETKHLNFSFETGLNCSKLTSRPSYNDVSYSRDTTFTTEITHSGYYNYFEIQILNLDSLLENDDSIYITIHDSIFIPTTDTIVKPVINIKNNISKTKTYNSYSYIELPLIMGYTFSQGKLSLTLRAGVIAGLLTKTSGYLPNPYSEFGKVEVDNNTVRKLLFSGIIGLEMAYNVSDKISITLSPLYKFSLTSVNKNDFIVDEKFKNTTLKLGIKYKLN